MCGQVHVMPVQDLRDHEPSTSCWCHPTECDDQFDVYVHHALDGREQYENGELLPQ